MKWALFIMNITHSNVYVQYRLFVISRTYTGWLKNNGPFASASQTVPNISRGSVTTCSFIY